MSLLLECLLQKSDVVSLLGRSQIEESKAGLLLNAAEALLESGVDRSESVSVFWVPGRIEVLGKHTDYAGGRSLLSATGCGFFYVSAPREDSVLRVAESTDADVLEIEIDRDPKPLIEHWSNYPQTVCRRLARNFGMPIKGANVAFASDLPVAAGMSSSSAMIVGFYLVLAKANALVETENYTANISCVEDLAGYLGTIENGQSFGSLVGDKGVGTFGGSEDHTAILCCRPGSLSQYAYCPVRYERTIQVPTGFRFAVAVSGVAAEKTGEARSLFNRASLLAQEAASVWESGTGNAASHLAAVLTQAGGPGEVREKLNAADSSTFTRADLLDRFDHFYYENEEILPAAGDALAREDLEEFGDLVDRSQRLGEQLLKNQVGETVFLATAAREAGAIAASAFGAGFGGSVWALTHKDDAQKLLTGWKARYEKSFPDSAARSQFFVTDAGPAATEI